MDRLKRAAVRVATVAVVGVCLYFTLRGLSLPMLGRALAAADLRLLVLVVLPLLAVGSVLRTARYAALLPGAGPGRFFNLWASVMLSTAGNNVLPLRGGELLRTRETVAAGYPLGRVAVAQISEKTVEGVSMVVLSAPVLLAYLGARASLLGGLALVVAAVPLARWVLPKARVTLRQLGVSLAWSLASDAVEVAVVSACLAAVALPAGLLPSLTLFASVNLAILLPSTPGNLGTFEAGAALPLLAMGVDRDAAVAFALVYRATQWLPVNLVGLALWARRSRPRAPAPAGAS